MSADALHGTILVADDEDSVRWVLVKALEGAGHTVVQSNGGRDALCSEPAEFEGIGDDRHRWFAGFGA